MYRSLSAAALGVSGMQSELIELALTYKFRGIEVDIVKFGKQVELRGMEHARRLLDSAKVKIASFEMPVRWQGEEDSYKEDLQRLDTLAKYAAEVGSTGCHTYVQPACNERPYHENFEFHRARFSEIADVLAPHGMRLGIGFLAPAYHRADSDYQFISSPDALLTLMKTTGVSNIGVAIDMWHWHVGGGTVDQLRELTSDQIVLVRLADVPEDAQLDQITETDRLLPGETGVVPNASALSILSEIGFDGPVTPYPNPETCAGQTRDRIIQRAAQSLAKMFQEAEVEVADVVAASISSEPGA